MQKIHVKKCANNVKSSSNDKNNEDKDKIVDLEKDPKTDEYKPKE